MIGEITCHKMLDGGDVMTKDSNVAYNHFAHLNKFLKKSEDYRAQSTSEDENKWVFNATEANIYKKSKSNLKQKGHIK